MHLFIVSGASGAGKTTFIKKIISGEIADPRFPEGVRDWPVFVKKLCHDFDRSAPGYILEYDIENYGLAKFRGDPVLRVLHLAKSITVVHLSPPRERLIEQLSRREGGGYFWPLIAIEIRLWPLLCSKYVPQQTRRRFKDRQRTWHKIQTYNHPGAVDSLNRRWQNYLDTVPAPVRMINA